MSKYSFRKYQPLSLRIWHWANSIIILGLLGTVLIRKTFLSWRTNSAVIQEKMSEIGVSITPEFAKEVAVTIRDPLYFLLGKVVNVLRKTKGSMNGGDADFASPFLDRN